MKEGVKVEEGAAEKDSGESFLPHSHPREKLTF